MMVSGIVAEMSNAHNGSLERAHRIIEAAAKAGADWLKFQCFTVPELCALRGVAEDEPVPVEPWTDMTMGELYGRAETPHSWFPSLIRKCEEVGIPWFSSVFGLDSLALLEKLGCPVYKLASLDVAQDGFRFHVAQTGKPLIQSMPEPMPDVKAGTVLFCPPGYPQKVNFAALRAALKWADGFSYHGTDPAVPAKAIELGAKVVECHVMLDDEPSELESNVSLTITQLAELCDESRRLVPLDTSQGLNGVSTTSQPVELGPVSAMRRTRGRGKAKAKIGVIRNGEAV
jgi:sialic acid synthase SpsE